MDGVKATPADLREVIAALRAFVEHWDGYGEDNEWEECEDKTGAAILKRAKKALSRLGSREGE